MQVLCLHHLQTWNAGKERLWQHQFSRIILAITPNNGVDIPNKPKNHLRARGPSTFKPLGSLLSTSKLLLLFATPRGLFAWYVQNFMYCTQFMYAPHISQYAESASAVSSFNSQLLS